jgi:hypothetical protein
MLVKLPNIRFHGNPFSHSQVVMCGQTDMEKLRGAFLHLLFVNTPTNLKRDNSFNGNGRKITGEAKTHLVIK